MDEFRHETDRLILRPHRREDFPDVAALWADPLVVRYISGVPSSPEASWARLLRNMGHWQAMGYGYWAVIDRESDGFLGEVGFSDFRRDIEPRLDGLPEAGWVLAPHAHGRGIASEAVTAMLASSITPASTPATTPRASVRSDGDEHDQALLDWGDVLGAHSAPIGGAYANDGVGASGDDEEEAVPTGLPIGEAADVDARSVRQRRARVRPATTTTV